MGGSRRVWVVDSGDGAQSEKIRLLGRSGSWVRCALGGVSATFPAAPVVASLVSWLGAGGHDRASAGDAAGWYLFDRLAPAGAPPAPRTDTETVLDALAAFDGWLEALGASHPGAYRRRMASPAEATFDADLARGGRLIGRLLWHGGVLYASCASHDPARSAAAYRFVDSMRVEPAG